MKSSKSSDKYGTVVKASARREWLITWDKETTRRRRRGEEEEETRRGGGGGDEEETRRGGGGGDEEETQRPGHHAPRNPPPHRARAHLLLWVCGIKWDVN